MISMATYEICWRNKWLTANAMNIEDMIFSLRAAADELEDMKEDGVELENEEPSDDYAMLITSDPTVAEKHEMSNRDDMDFDSEENFDDDNEVFSTMESDDDD
jgi:hypothetical protein